MIESLEEEVNMLDRHLQVLNTVMANEPIGIVKLSRELGYPHHKVRYSLRILEEAGLIEPTPNGAMTTDHVEGFVNTVADDLGASIDHLDSMRIDTAEIPQ
jgi:predicted transcriptional regulator